MRKEVIGDCTLYLGDCYDILPKLQWPDLIITDPPYVIHAGVGGGAFGKRSHLVDTGGFTDSGCDYSILERSLNWVCFCSFAQVEKLLALAKNKDRRALLTWNKPNPVPTCNNKYLPDTEFIVHGFDKGNLFGGYKDKSTFFVYPCGNKTTTHPNEKPLPLMEKLLNVAAGPDFWCVDPFMGSGTTGVACVNNHLSFTGIEREEKYFYIACKRIEKAYKTRPRLFDNLPKKEAVQLDMFGA